MAMNKKEREALEFAEKELAIAQALRWSRVAPLPPDIDAPQSGFTQGWMSNPYSGVVRYMWSEPAAHGEGAHPEGYPRSASQRGRALYSTKLKALQALRYEMERDFANKLAGIDKQIKELEQP